MCVGPLKRVCHWGPLAAFVIIKLVTCMTAHCCSMWWPPMSSLGGFLNKSIFLTFSALTIYNFLSAIFEGPGYVPLHWRPANPADEHYLQFCKVCQGYKAPRAHHCRRCGRCVLKMDHHCPWINNCVGHDNHTHFTVFLMCGIIGCLHSTVILSCCLYRGLHRAWYLYHGIETHVEFSLYTLILTVFALGLSIGVVLAVGMLLYFQLKVILRNRTGIEDWIIEKAYHRRSEIEPPFIYPYDLGCWENFKQVFNWFGPKGDGITWPVVKGCHQYSLTIEQKAQKSEKRLRTRPYTVVHRYSGRWFPIAHGWRVLTHPPLTDEPRIPLEPQDIVLVTRWRRYWLFGERTSSSCGSKARGWFPRCCVVELSACDECDSDSMEDDKKNQ